MHVFVTFFQCKNNIRCCTWWGWWYCSLFALCSLNFSLHSLCMLRIRKEMCVNTCAPLPDVEHLLLTSSLIFSHETWSANDRIDIMTMFSTTTGSMWVLRIKNIHRNHSIECLSRRLSKDMLYVWLIRWVLVCLKISIPILWSYFEKKYRIFMNFERPIKTFFVYVNIQNLNIREFVA